MILRCTAKARTLLSVRQVADPGPSEDDWYVNLLWFDRRKCLLLAHVGTLFPVLVPDVRKADLTHSTSRQMLGFMNEMAWSAECAISDAAGLARCDFDELNREQRRMLHNRDGDDIRPIELARLRQRGSSNSRRRELLVCECDAD